MGQTSPQPFLDVHFKPADATTTEVVKSLYDQMDHRHKGAKDWKASHAVICGILALRWADSFKATTATLDRRHKDAFDAVVEGLTGTLVQRVGRSTYRVHPSLAATTAIVKDTRPSDYRFRIFGHGVSYASQASIQSARPISLLNGQHAVPLILRDVGSVVEHQYQSLPLPPNYWSSLPPIEVSGMSHDIVCQYRAFVQKVMQRFGYVGVLVNGTDDNALEFAVLRDYAHEFPQWLYQVSIPFWKTAKPILAGEPVSLKKVLFPADIYHRQDPVQHLKGQCVQHQQERMSGQHHG